MSSQPAISRNTPRSAMFIWGDRVPGKEDAAFMGQTGETTENRESQGSPGKPTFGQTAAERAQGVDKLNLWTAIIAAVGVLGSALITGWFNLLPEAGMTQPLPTPPSTRHSATPFPASGLPGYQEALDGLASNDSTAWEGSINRLAVVIRDKSESPQVRQDVLRSLATFVRRHAPKTLARSYDYCLKNPPPLYVPPEVELALQTIGRKLPEDDELVINLTRINIAYASLPDLNLRNVRLDGSLLCRAILVNSKLEGASFRDTNLRFSWMQGSQGLTADQLTLAASLQKAELPAHLVNSPVLSPMLVNDPELKAS
ncbi:pentapeptide repeat-containing protein [Micromonospora sp. C51]|uniref:pentapeptide repeat-containing protein n=1 Tax=Micromonospora sp. C51 TaxID=2824879 RepID=UPI001B37A25B|nr:pentapeptide repeat-containing protein [Micromonospora sp. C51]MBQ1052739.1 pentapeptide repeat-containing protein [Micromonospora sp. C51]